MTERSELRAHLSRALSAAREAAGVSLATILERTSALARPGWFTQDWLQAVEGGGCDFDRSDIVWIEWAYPLDEAAREALDAYCAFYNWTPHDIAQLAARPDNWAALRAYERLRTAAASPDLVVDAVREMIRLHDEGMGDAGYPGADTTLTRILAMLGLARRCTCGHAERDHDARVATPAEGGGYRPVPEVATACTLCNCRCWSRELGPIRHSPPSQLGYYVLSLTYADASDLAAWWGPRDGRYVTSLDEAGVYTEEQIRTQRGHYDNGKSTRAIPVAEARALAAPIVPAHQAMAWARTGARREMDLTARSTPPERTPPVSYDRDDSTPPVPRPTPAPETWICTGRDYEGLFAGLHVAVIPLSNGWRWTVWPPSGNAVSRGFLKHTATTTLATAQHLAVLTARLLAGVVTP